MRIPILASVIAILLFIGFGFKSMLMEDSSVPTKSKLRKNKAELQKSLDFSTIKNLSLPSGFSRVEIVANSFGDYLLNLPLKPQGTDVLTYNNNIPSTNQTAFAVIDLPVGNKDLLQCADAIMCLRAKYLYQQKRKNEIVFPFVSGFKCDYNTYTQGYRFDVKTNKWVQKSQVADNEAIFEKYLELVYTYASTISLSKSLKNVNNTNDLQIGDVFIKAGSPGHCFLVVDKCKNDKNEVKYAILQGFMPAQSMHLLKNNTGTHWFSPNEDYATQISYGDLLQSDYHKRF